MKKCNYIHVILLILMLQISSDLKARERVNTKKPPQNATDMIIRGKPLPIILFDLPLESFENITFPPDGWTKVTNLGGTGWQRGTVGSDVPGFELPAPVDAPSNGENAVALCSWATGDEDMDFNTGQATDQWLITPQINNVQDGDSLKFYLRYFAEFDDSLDILISTTGSNTEDFVHHVTQLVFTIGSDTSWTQYCFALTDFVGAGSNIYIAFREHVQDTAIEGDALFLDLVEVTSPVTGIADIDDIPYQFALSQNYPNPFNPSTNITFILPKTSQVSLKIYNLYGQVVSTLVDEKKYSLGQHSVQVDGANLASGIYFYRIEAENFAETKKMTLLR